MLRDCRPFLNFLEGVFSNPSPRRVHASAIQMIANLGYQVEGLSKSLFSCLKLWTNALYQTQQTNLYKLLGAYLKQIH